MPEGRFSSTALKMVLYAATAPSSPCASTAGSVTACPQVQVGDRLLRRVPSEGGLIENSRSPQREERGSAARIAGHVAAEANARAPTPAMLRSAADQFEDGGIERVAESAERAVRRSQAITYCVRSFEPMEKNEAGKASIVSAAAGTSTMMPSSGKAAANPAASSSRDDLPEKIARRG